eukprot:14808221-Alexandrium_andersonii.AAC.2
MSKWEYAKLQGLKWDPKDEEANMILDAELEGFTTRPHEKEALKAKGFLQYYITKQNLSETSGEKKRQVTGSKRQQCTSDELGDIEDMIDNEDPVMKIPGRLKDESSHPKKSKKGNEAEQQKKMEEQKAKREAKLSAMSKAERKEFEAKEGYDSFIKELKGYETRLNQALNQSFKYTGKLQTMKEPVSMAI